jgi:hypothetical protein
VNGASEYQIACAACKDILNRGDAWFQLPLAGKEGAKNMYAQLYHQVLNGSDR